ncbi:CGNR zinc finger domain-containing protein, partial [Micromonospora azadirachtae]
PGSVARFVDGVSCRPSVVQDGIAWTLDLPRGRSAAARVVLAWDALRVSSPGRLRPCANPECRRFLVDHSKSNSARWCSMAICGNRMKARRHYERTRQPGGSAR